MTYATLWMSIKIIMLSKIKVNLKSDIMYDSIFEAFLELWNYEVEKQISDSQKLGIMGWG